MYFCASHVLRASAPADVMCWQCVWFSPAAGWPAGFLNIRARLGAEPVLSRTGSPDGAQPALAAPYTGAAVAPPGRGGKAVKNPGSSSVPAAAAAAPGGARRTAAANTVFGSRREREGALSRPSPVQGRRNAPGRKCLALRLGLGDTPCHLHLPLDEIPIYSPVLGAAVQHLPDPF